MFACILCVLSGLSLHIDLLNWVYHSDLWAKRSMAIRYVIACYGGVLAVSALASYLMIRCRATTLSALCVHGARSVAKEVRLSSIWFCKTTEIKDAAVWLVLISAVGAAVRSYFLAQPIRYDEAYTFLNFVNSSLSDMFWYSFLLPSACQPLLQASALSP
jgi:hypothetical protein